MIGLLLCLLAFGTTVWAGRKSLPLGLIAMLSWGTMYGIIRAQFPAAASYFMFDCSIMGLYLTQIKLLAGGDSRTRELRIWVTALTLWPCLMLFVPMQDFLIQLVGLRGNIFFLPMLILGASLNEKDRSTVALGMAIQNIVALGFGVGEYFLGVERFYPLNATTMLIYSSNDVAGYQYFRIPATYVSAHVFAGSVATTAPFLYAGWMDHKNSNKLRFLLALGIVAAAVGVLMSATKMNFAILAILIAMMLLSGGIGAKQRIAAICAVAAIATLASTNERFGRFKGLGDSAGVVGRINGSVNRGFFEILAEYPMGNGLGGGGTSIPSFLADRVKHSVAMENEYAKILLEQGVIGLLIWIGFILWFVLLSKAFMKTRTLPARRVAFVCSVLYFGAGSIGLGMLTAMPETVLMLLVVGWVAAPPIAEPDSPGSEVKEVNRRKTYVIRRPLPRLTSARPELS